DRRPRQRWLRHDEAAGGRALLLRTIGGGRGSRWTRPTCRRLGFADPRPPRRVDRFCELVVDSESIAKLRRFAEDVADRNGATYHGWQAKLDPGLTVI